MEQANFQLIDSQFEAIDAIHLISTLYNAKIEYHHRQILKKKEHNEGNFGVDEERIKGLEKERNAFVAKAKEALEKNYNLKINGNLTVSFMKQS